MVLGATGAVLALDSAGQLHPAGPGRSGRRSAAVGVRGPAHPPAGRAAAARPALPSRASGTIALVMTTAARLRCAQAGAPATPPRRLGPRRPSGRGRRTRAARLPGGPAVPALLRPADHRPRRDDRSPGRRPRATGTSVAAPVTSVLEQACDDGATRKTLWRGHDGTRAESVLMGYPDRATVCVSSQAGCGMACPFCATGQGGLQRNLSTAEIVEQVRQPPRPPGTARWAPRCGCPTWCSWAWASRWPTTAGWSRRCAGSPSRRPTGWASRPAGSPCPRSVWCRPSTS